MIVVDKKKEKLVRFFLFEIINLKVDKVRYSGYNYRILEIMCFYLVDRENAGYIMNIIDEIQQREKTTIVLVTHDREIANRAHRQIELEDGVIVRDELLVE